MGKVKDWMLTHQECPICGKCFLPWERHDEDRGILTTCSTKCDNEADEFIESMGDSNTQEGETDYE